MNLNEKVVEPQFNLTGLTAVELAHIYNAMTHSPSHRTIRFVTNFTVWNKLDDLLGTTEAGRAVKALSAEYNEGDE